MSYENSHTFTDIIQQQKGQFQVHPSRNDIQRKIWHFSTVQEEEKGEDRQDTGNDKKKQGTNWKENREGLNDHTV